MNKLTDWENGTTFTIDNIEFNMVHDVSVNKWYARIGHTRVTNLYTEPADAAEYLEKPRYDVMMAIACQCADFVYNTNKEDYKAKMYNELKEEENK